MDFDYQPTNLESKFVKLVPLGENDFESLYQVASDPDIWKQHPNPTRYQREVFQVFFEGAIKSGGAFLVFNAKTNELIGSSRYYDFNIDTSQISIGYTFLICSHWGTMYNHALKTVMLNHAFRFVNSVIFHIGSVNIRSQKAIEKLGAIRTGEQEMHYYGEQNNVNFIYEIKRSEWEKR